MASSETDEVQKFTAEERIEKLKKIKKQREQEIKEAEKLLHEAEDEIKDTQTFVEKVPIPQVATRDTTNLSEEGKLKDNEINEICVKFPKDAIREVILSPGSSDKTKHMAEDLLKKYDYNCEVRKSIVDIDSI